MEGVILCPGASCRCQAIILPVSYDRPAATRDAIHQAIDAGFAHIVLSLLPPYPVEVAHWVADELIGPAAGSGKG